METSADRAFSFGPYLFTARTMRLTHEGSTVRLGARASAILLALIEEAGNLITKEQLLARVWAGEQVGDGNLRVQITTIRKALADQSQTPRYISNVAGRGYRFVAPVQIWMGNSSPPTSKEGPQRRRNNVPASLSKLLGRDEEIALVCRQLVASRLVTIVGTGGIGKTTVAIAAARQVSPRFGDEVFFVDLAAVASPEFVPFAIAAAVNVAIEAERPVSSLVARLRNSSALIILDNCEHLTGVVSTVVDEILRLCSGISVLATSHEPLRVDEERVFRLAPFSLVSGAERLTLDIAVATQPAVALFVEHAVSNDDTVALGDSDVPHIVEICKRLDGLPLAIEIAASRVGALGTAELAARLDDRLGLFAGGRRTVTLRHQTLRGLLDWSFDNLGQIDRQVLRRLAVFAGDFTLESATAVAGNEGISWANVTESLASLVRKSLLNTASSRAGVTYRLLDSTRLHALEKLEEEGELPRLRDLHTRYLCSMLQRAETDWIQMRQSDWLDLYDSWFDDVRAAMGWAFGPHGDASLGVLLCTLAMPLGLQLGLVDEVRDRILVALGRAEHLEPPPKIQQMRLNLAYGYVCFNQNQPFAAYFQTALRLADEIGLDRYKIEPLVQLAGTTMAKGRYVEAIEICQPALALADKIGDPFASLAVNRVLAQVSHFVGEHARSITVANEVIAFPVASIPVTYGFVATDRRVSMRVTLARSLWITGKSDQAVAVSEDALALAEEGGALAVCQALAIAAIPVRMWRGEWDAARRLTATLRENSERFAIAQWIEWARVFENALESQILGASLNFKPVDPLYAHTLTTVTGVDATGESELSERNWCAPELLRVKGETLSRKELDQGLALVAKGRDLARQQDALAWELRCAISLLRLDPGVMRAKELAVVLSKIDEGRETADLRAAAEMLRRS